MYRPAATEVPHLADEIVPAASGETPEIVTVLRALRADDSSVVPLADSGRLEAVDTRLGAGPVAWAVEAARDALSLAAPALDGSPEVSLGGSADARFHESLLLDILVLLTDGDGAGDDLARMAHLARDLERTADDLPDLVARLRSAQRFWTGLLLDHAVGLSAGTRVIREITVLVGACFDRLADEAVTRRSSGRAARSGPGPDRRRHLVDALVHGAPVDPGRVGTELGVDLGHPHRALVLTRNDGPPAHGDELDVAAAAVARALGGAVALRHETADGALWVWLAGTRPTPTLPDLAGLAEAHVRVGVGGSRPGLTGLRRSHLEARDAHQFAGGPRGPFVRYEDVAFAALLCRDPERARWFVTTQLGPLAGTDETSEELRRTLCTYYASGMRLASTAAALHLHRNTLVNRLHRIEKLLGREVVERVAETHSALLLIDHAGSSVVDG